MEVHKSINFLKANAYVMLSRLPENLLFSLRVLFLISDFNFVTCTSFCNDAMPTDCLIHSCCLMFQVSDLFGCPPSTSSVISSELRVNMCQT